MQHVSSFTGSETLQLYNAPDVTGTVTIGGSAVTVTTTVPGQNAVLTFSGTSGQKVSINLSSGTYSVCNLTLQNPGGSALTNGSCGGASSFVDPVTLGSTGTYTILIDPSQTATGSVTVQLNNDADVTGTITPQGRHGGGLSRIHHSVIDVASSRLYFQKGVELPACALHHFSVIDP